MSPARHRRLGEMMKAENIARMVLLAHVNRLEPWQVMEIAAETVEALPDLRSEVLGRARRRKNGDER